MSNYTHRDENKSDASKVITNEVRFRIFPLSLFSIFMLKYIIQDNLRIITEYQLEFILRMDSSGMIRCNLISKINLARFNIPTFLYRIGNVDWTQNNNIRHLRYKVSQFFFWQERNLDLLNINYKIIRETLIE